MRMEKAKLKILRYQPSTDFPIYKDYEVPFEQGLTILKALFLITDSYEDPPAFRRYYCNRGQCASCVMTINGKMGRACTTQLKKEITLEPAYGYPVIRDLVVDFGRKVFSPPDHYTKIMEGSLILKPPPMKFRANRLKKVLVKVDNCQACQSKECINACWLNKLENLEDRFGRRRSHTILASELICAQCLNSPCAEICPTGAIGIKKGMITGINPLLCIGCWICMDNCSYGVIWMNIGRGHAVKCDLCGGEPICVRECPHEAIQILDP